MKNQTKRMFGGVSVLPTNKGSHFANENRLSTLFAIRLRLERKILWITSMN